MLIFRSFSYIILKKKLIIFYNLKEQKILFKKAYLKIYYLIQIFKAIQFTFPFFIVAGKKVYANGEKNLFFVPH